MPTRLAAAVLRAPRRTCENYHWTRRPCHCCGGAMDFFLTTCFAGTKVRAPFCGGGGGSGGGSLCCDVCDEDVVGNMMSTWLQP